MTALAYDHMTSTVADGAALNLISFEVDGRSYGVDITCVREIRAWSGVTALPNAPEYVRGVMNLRGAVIPIVDLRARFGCGQTDATPNHVVVVVDIAEKWIGLLVDAVSDIVDVPAASVQPAGDFALDPATSSAAGVLRGVASVNDRMISLISAQTLLTGVDADAPLPPATAG